MDTLIRRLATSPMSLVAVTWTRGDELEVQAFSLIYPLSTIAVARIESGTVATGADLRLDDLCSREQAAGFYLAMVGSRNRRHLALRLMVSHLVFLATGSPAYMVAARGATQEGSLLVRHLGFQRRPEPSQIWTTGLPHGWSSQAAVDFVILDSHSVMAVAAELQATAT
jgi:hypothetical protein